MNEIKRLQKLAGLNEWKIKPITINPNELDKYGRFDPNRRAFIIQIDQNTINWMNKYYPGWDEDYDIEQEGMARFYDEVERTAKIKYGNDVRQTRSGELIEWKIKSPTISPDDVDQYGYFWNNIFTVRSGSDEYADWMETHFFGWQDDEEIDKRGTEVFYNEVTKAAKAKYGDNITVFANFAPRL